MENKPVLVCEEFYCPDCGSEVFCSIMPDKSLEFYLSREGNARIEKCPECQLDLTSVSYQEPGSSKKNKGKTASGNKRHTVGRKELARTLKETKSGEFSSIAAADRALTAIGDTLTEIIASGENLRWPGVGTFKLKKRSARRVRNPQTGEMMDVPSKMGLTFVPAEKLKKKIENEIE